MITLTNSAVNRVRDMVSKKELVIGIRMSVIQSGCSGYSYALDFVETIADDDLLIEQDGVKLVVDLINLPILDNVELDFVKDGLNQNFKFNNPNVAALCGCGESFSIIK